MRQKGLDASWIIKNGISHYGYKNSICIDVEHGFISRYAITQANIHDSQILPQILKLENKDNIVWADSGCAGLRHEDLLAVAGFKSRIHEKGTRCHSLSEEAKKRNKDRSSVRARVEHVFGAITTGMGGKLTRRTGLATSKAWWGLRNLAYNLLRYQHCSSKTVLAA